MKKPSLFESQSKPGIVDLYFTEEELITLIELLVMTKQICKTAISNLDPILDAKAKVSFEDKIEAASILLEKILTDSSPGVPQGDLH